MIGRTKDPISFGEVCDAIEEIVRRGENPTIARVRTELGDRGSNTTITKFIKAWKENYHPNSILGSTHDSTTQNQPVRRLASDHVHQLVDKIWEQLQRESDVVNQQIKAEADQAIETANEQKQQIGEERIELISTLDRLNKEMTELEQRHRQLTENYNKESKEHGIAQQQLTDAKALYDNMLVQKDENIKSITKTNQYLTKQLEQLENQKKEEISELKSHIENQRHQFMAELDAKKTEIKKQAVHIQKLEILQQKTADMNAELNRKNTKQEQELKITEKRRQELADKNNQLQKEIVKQETINESITESNQELKHDIHQQKREYETKIQFEQKNRVNVEKQLFEKIAELKVKDQQLVTKKVASSSEKSGK